MTDKIKRIKNEQWPIKELAAMILKGEIDKPKYQRKRKWSKFPKKENFPSDRKYIEFLYSTRNSVHPITFGQVGDRVYNIDGNNRLNAIMNYLEEPFILFEEKTDKLTKYITEKINPEIAKEVENIIKKMRYDEVMIFKYNSYFIEKGYTELFDTHLRPLRDDIEPFFEKMIDSLKIDGINRFDSDVVINVNLFYGNSTEELSEVFWQINKYNSGLSEQESLASTLFTITDFKIENELIEYGIQQQVEQYYTENSRDEKLNCYVYNKTLESLNAFDFIIGFQNYSNNKCSMIEKNDNDGTSLFIKIFKIMYKRGKLYCEAFTSENINDFIKHIEIVIDILEKISQRIFMKELVNGGNGSNKLFDAVNKKLTSLKKNNKYMIISAIIGYIKNGVYEEVILRSIEKCILYHFMVNSLENKEKQKDYKTKDEILHDAGGNYIDNKANRFLSHPEDISDNITKDVMRNLINDLVDENTINRDYETRSNGKSKYDKRRPRKMHEKILLYYYYVNNIPTKFLKHNFWIEHMFPFSCSWENQIDIDRLGNIMPIINTLNKDRGNKHIREYKNLDEEGFLQFIKIFPSEKLYDEIIPEVNRKPHIEDSEKYNSHCSENEKELIESFLGVMFKI